MAKQILIIGESGSGKTTSMRNLPHAETFYIDCDGKGLPWRGWREQYNNENKNYYKTSDAAQVIGTLKVIGAAENYKYIVIDTLNAIMISDEFRRMKEKSYDKWQDLAASVYNIIELGATLRDDLTIIYVAHSQTERDDSGYMFTRIRTSGKKLDKIVLESKFSTVLQSVRKDGKYVFVTRSDNSTCKVPLGAIDTDEIENDITLIIKALEEF